MCISIIRECLPHQILQDICCPQYVSQQHVMKTTMLGVSFIATAVLFLYRGWGGHSQHSCICRICYRGGREVGERLVFVNISFDKVSEVSQVAIYLNMKYIIFYCLCFSCGRLGVRRWSGVRNWDRQGMNKKDYQLLIPCYDLNECFLRTEYDKYLLKMSFTLPDLSTSPRSSIWCHRGAAGAWWRESRSRDAALQTPERRYA